MWTGVGRSLLRLALACLAALGPAWPQKYYTYIGDVGETSALVAWGTAQGEGNTIGLKSTPAGKGAVRIDGRDYPAGNTNWVRIENLAHDREYRYEVSVNGRNVGGGVFRTHPRDAGKLAFFVIGDYGDGGNDQFALAEVMRRELEQRRNSENPVRFVLTAGDNIYGSGFKPFLFSSGNQDSHWERRFYQPYEHILRNIPFYACPGNHDGDESERRGDLDVYLDNFFFPGGTPSRYYGFRYGKLAEFFSLDSTSNAPQDPKSPIYGPESEQTKWLAASLSNSAATWKIPYLHHPFFNAGPRHEPSLERLRHWADLFRQNGVKVVFAGHEHNFQFSERNEATGNLLYVVSGSGGALRGADIRRNLKAAHIAGWANQHHFLLVEIDGASMTLTPYGIYPMRVLDGDGKEVAMPLKVTRKQDGQ